LGGISAHSGDDPLRDNSRAGENDPAAGLFMRV